MAVVPKIVEGLQARYVTGSGQTAATADRVLIFEREGECSPFNRGGRRKAKKVKAKRKPVDGDGATRTKKKRMKRPSTHHDADPTPSYSFPCLVQEDLEANPDDIPANDNEDNGDDDDDELMEAITILLPADSSTTIDSELLMPRSVLNDPKYDVFAGYM